MKSWQDSYSELIRDGEMPLCGLRVISFLNSDGEKKFRFRWAGDAEIPELIGLLEILKCELVDRIDLGNWEDEK